MKSTISPYCHFGMHDQGPPAARLTCAAYIDDKNVFLCDGKIASFVQVAMEPGKRYALRAYMPEAATDWLNQLSLGTMSASA